MLKHGILGLLNYHAITGYEIMTAFRDSLHFFWNAQTSQIYRELQTLEANGWAEKTAVSQKERPDKNVYRITPDGRAELLRWLADDEAPLGTKSPLLMKVFFLGERSREENIRFFAALQDTCRLFLRSLEDAQASIGAYRGMLDAPDKALYWEMTIDYGRRNMQMHLDWAQRCIERLMEESV